MAVGRAERGDIRGDLRANLLRDGNSLEEPSAGVVDIDGVVVPGSPMGRRKREAVEQRAAVAQGMATMREVAIARAGEDAQARALHGLSRALINNMVRGVSATKPTFATVKMSYPA